MIADLIVVGAGPAGRVLAHRGAAAGLHVTLVDPDVHRPWVSTFGMYSDDAPGWLDAAAVASRSTTFTVFTPGRRVVPRGYLVLDPALLQGSLTLTGVTVVEAFAASVSDSEVRLSDGRVLTGRCVIDARGTGHGGQSTTPRQTAYGVFVDDRDDETVLMDWRPADPTAGPATPPSFSYRIPTAHGRLTQETCLAGRPPIAIGELARRAHLRDCELPIEAPVEVVDFPMYATTTPWRRRPGTPTTFGAAGGLMNPATGYSVAQSFTAADIVVEAIVAHRDPHASLWTPRARAAYRLRVIGLAVLLSLSAHDLVKFFDAFFTLPTPTQRAYVSSRDDVAGIVRAMASVFGRCPPRLKVTIATASVRAALRQR